jgi:hypothetical protein
MKRPQGTLHEKVAIYVTSETRVCKTKKEKQTIRAPYSGQYAESLRGMA